MYTETENKCSTVRNTIRKDINTFRERQRENIEVDRLDKDNIEKEVVFVIKSRIEWK